MNQAQFPDGSPSQARRDRNAAVVASETLGRAKNAAGGERQLRELLDFAKAQASPERYAKILRSLQDPRDTEATIDNLRRARSEHQREAVVQATAAAGGCTTPAEVRQAIAGANAGDAAAHNRLAATPLSIIGGIG